MEVYYNGGVMTSGRTTDTHQGIGGAELAERLRDGFQAIVKYVHRRLGEAGYDDIRPAHMTIFQHLSPEGSRIGELSKRTHLTNQSVGYLVDYLDQHGYVERRPDPRNRRATLVCLTAKGWEEMRACALILDDVEAHLMRRLASDRLLDLHKLLADLGNALESLE